MSDYLYENMNKTAKVSKRMCENWKIDLSAWPLDGAPVVLLAGHGVTVLLGVVDEVTLPLVVVLTDVVTVLNVVDVNIDQDFILSPEN